MFWIKEEDNREEIASSFSGLGKVYFQEGGSGGGGGGVKLEKVFHGEALPRGSKPCHLYTLFDRTSGFLI